MPKNVMKIDAKTMWNTNPFCFQIIGKKELNPATFSLL